LVIHDEHGTSDIAEAIAGIAEGTDAAMVVVGTRGRGSLAGAVLGSVSQRLLAVSRIPVVVVRAAEA
jgi:nucleotide-binding universal stress UspA family protein